MFVAIFVVVVWSHVPTYGGCIKNCCTPPHTHTTSQVIYLHGSGGLEVHVDSHTSPFDTVNNEVIDFDAVFKERYDPSTYVLYYGCGGCMPDDPLSEATTAQVEYQPFDVEPFTTTSYTSAFPKDKRLFQSELLQNCTQAHFTVRIVDFQNRTDGRPITWGAVIGLGESFTFVELLEFPIYILRNHGETWNNLPQTYWIWLLLGAPLLIAIVRELCRLCMTDVLDPYPVNPFHDLMVVYGIGTRLTPRSIDPREPFYELALIAFTAAALEEFTHLMYAQSDHPAGWGLWVGLVLVILVAQGLPIAFVLTVWWGLRHRKDGWVISKAWWAPLEWLTGVSLLLFLGAGFFVGPSAIVVAASIRFREFATDPVVDEELFVQYPWRGVRHHSYRNVRL